jgi:hypothetical protein
LPVYEVKRLNQALWWLVGLIGCSVSLSKDFWAFHPYKRKGKIIVVCILIFIFLDSRQENKILE